MAIGAFHSGSSLRVVRQPDGLMVEVPWPGRPRISRHLRKTAIVLAVFFVVLAFAAEQVGLFYFAAALLVVAVLPSRRETRMCVRSRDETLLFEPGATAKGRLIVATKAVQDIRVDFAGGYDGATPRMALVLCQCQGADIVLLAGHPAADLLHLADLLRARLGLPTRLQRTAAWFADKAAHAPGESNRPVPAIPVAPPRSAPAPLPARYLMSRVQDAGHLEAAPVEQPPVLWYAGPDGPATLGAPRSAVEFKPDAMMMWIPHDQPWTGYLAINMTHLHVVSRQEAITVPIANLYGAIVDGLEPARLQIATLDAVYEVLLGQSVEALQDAAILLNDLLGVGGSVYHVGTDSNETKSDSA